MKKSEYILSLNKKKYTKEEVASILKDNVEKVEDELNLSRKEQLDLMEENNRLKKELNSIKNSDTKATYNKSQDQKVKMEEEISLRYSLVVEKLKSFCERWDSYFSYLKEKYPFYPVINQSIELKDKIKAFMSVKEKDNEKDISQIDNALKRIERGEKSVVGTKTMANTPKTNISTANFAISENGFNMEEVLNPGELRLEDLCKELLSD